MAVSRMSVAYIRFILQSQVSLTLSTYFGPEFDVAWEYIKHAIWNYNLIYSLFLNSASTPTFCT
jgi:hypothetical protein